MHLLEFNKLLKTCRSQDGFPRYFLKILTFTVVQQMKMTCWLSGHRPQYGSCIANRTVQYLARSLSSVFGGGGTKTWAGTLTQPRPDEFGMLQRSGEYIAPNPVLSFFGMNFALKFGGED